MKWFKWLRQPKTESMAIPSQKTPDHHYARATPRASRMVTAAR